MSFLIRLLVGAEYCYMVSAEEKQAISFGSGPKDTVFVNGWIPSQLKVRIVKNELRLTGKKMPDLQTKSIASGEAGINISQALKVSINWVPNSGVSKNTFALPYRGIVTIGRSKSNTIVLSNQMVSGKHVVLRCENGMVRVEDGYNGRPSTNGTYLNGRRIRKGAMKSGDVLDIMNFRIRLVNTSLTFENTGPFLSFGILTQSSQEQEATERFAEPVFRRSPRVRETLPQQAIVLAKAPPKGNLFQKRRGLFTSLLSSGAMLGASVATGMVSPALLAARAAGLVAPVANMAMNSGDNRKEKKQLEQRERRRQEQYGAYIEAQKARIQLTAEQQRKVLTDENPSPEECLTLVQGLRPRLWERHPEDSDFLDVRIGMGYEPICVEVKTPSDVIGFQMEEDETEELARQIVEETRIVDSVPTRIRLLRYGSIGIVGQRVQVVSLLKNLLIALTTSHFYEDVRIVGIFDEQEKSVWEPIRWLPHVWDEEKQSRFLSFSEEGAEQLSDEFYELLRQRLREQPDYEERRPTPHYIFLLGSYRCMKKSKLMADLLRNSPMAGATAIFAYHLGDKDAQTQRTFLPAQCQYIINMDDINGPCAFEFARADQRVMFTPDPALSSSTFDSFCRQMAAIQVEEGAGKLELPGGITFLEGHGVSQPRELDIWNRWNTHDPKKVLDAPIGVMSNGKMLSIDIGNFENPPVALVAGMAGSGKSEFLKTWVLSLAMRYSPDELSIVIVDYKGGSMARTLERLPHVIGTITDIDSGDIMRRFKSLFRESVIRKKFVDKYGVEDLSKYRKGLRDGKYTEKMPMFLTVFDEFAELKMQHKEFMDELISWGRIMRSLGGRLILATQSPAGVVDDQIKDNSQFQICLKVQNAAASKSMIERPDAARITQNGRAYVRTGADKIFELVQTYWTGAPYMGNRGEKASTGNQVRIVDISGQRIKTVWEEKTRFKSETDELQAVISQICRIAEEHGIRRRECPWKPELPVKQNLTELDVPGGFDGADWRPGPEWLSFPVGLYDMPEVRKQGVLYANLETDGHCGIYGLPGKGKTTMLKTMIMSMGLCYSPKDVNLYIIDLGSQTLKLFEEMPHVAAVALGSEEEKMEKIAVLLGDMLTERKKIFAKNSVSSLKNYRSYVSDEMPAVILMIDNFLPLFELCPAFEPLIYKIGNEGAGCGIYLVYTANSVNGVRYNLTRNIHSGIAFEMSNKADYYEVVGKPHAPEALSRCKGRAFFRTSQDFFLNMRQSLQKKDDSVDGPVVFQAALYGEGENELEMNDWVKSKIEQMNRYWDGPAINTVPMVPEVVKVSDMLPHYTQRDLIPVGIDCVEIQPAFLDLHQHCYTMIIGIPGSGKSRFLCRIAGLVREGSFSQELYVFDSTRKGLAELSDAATEYTRTNDLDGVDRTITKIIKELIARQQALESLNEDADREAEILQHPQICVLVDDLRELIDLVDQSDNAFKRLNALIKNAAGLGLVFLAAANAKDVAELFTISPVVSRLVQSQNGLAISGTADMNSYYQQKNLSYEDKTTELKDGIGLLYQEGQAHRVKLMEE